MKKLAPLAIVLAGILWGCMGLFVRRYNAKGLTSMEMVALRSVVAGVGLFLFLLCFRREKLKFHIRDIWCFLGTGIGSVVFFNYCYFKTITLTSLSVAAVLLYTAPAMVMIMSRILFQEKFSRRKVLALIMTFAGCILVTGVLGDSGSISVSGLLVGLGAGFGYALYSIFGRYALERGYDSLTITCYTFIVAGITSFFMADMRQVRDVAFGSTDMIFFSIAFGLLCTIAPYLLYTLGLTYVENSKASIIATIEPVAATMLGVIVFHEQPKASGLVGMVFVLAAIFICREKAKA